LSNTQAAATLAAAEERYIVLPVPGNGTGEVLALPEAIELLRSLDTLIFDLDGVLIDPTRSIQRAHPLAIEMWLQMTFGMTDCAELVSPEDVAAFKLAGGFNDDWNIAESVALALAVKAIQSGAKDGAASLGGGMDGAREWLRRQTPPEIFEEASRICANGLAGQLLKEVIAGPFCREMYDFDAEYVNGEGTIMEDRLLTPPESLELPFERGVFTGRTYGEARVGLRLVGLGEFVPDERLISWNDGMYKPDGRPLAILTERIGSRVAAFIGDNPDDMRSVHLYRRNGSVPMLSVQVCFGAAADEAREVFIREGADLIAPDTGSALAALKALRDGGCDG
jgi:phosphoglycolate phosphatase-like HAD superfamily hydrolase